MTNKTMGSAESRELKALANIKSMDRRSFMQRAAALGVLSGAGTIWSQRPASAEQVKGGHAVFAVGNGAVSDTLDLGAPANPHTIMLMESTRSKLVDVATDGTLEPDLASEWQASDQGRKWTFKLHDGVEFHNGKTLDAQDVIDSINLHRAEDSTSGGAVLMKGVTEIRGEGQDVVFELDAPTADFPYYLAQYMFEIAPSKDGELDQSGVGTGPFVLESYEPGVRAIGKRFENYFGNGAHFDSFEYATVNDPAALVSGLLTGAFHAIHPVDLKIAQQLDNSAGVRVVSVSGGSSVTMPMHADKAPFDNVDLRLAMKYAIDREELRDKIFFGHASLANDHPVPAFDQFYNPELAQRQYDPEKAAFHYKKSGHSGALEIHAADAAFVGAVDAGVLYREQALKAGIDLKVTRAPSDGYWSEVWSKVPFCFAYWNARPTPDLILSLAYVSDAAWGDTYWSNAKFDMLVKEARAELDPAKRKELYAEVQVMLHNEGATVVPLFQNLVHGISDKIDTGGDVHGAAPYDSNRAFAKWSFKA